MIVNKTSDGKVSKELKESIENTISRVQEDGGDNATSSDLYNIIRWAKQGYLKFDETKF